MERKSFLLLTEIVLMIAVLALGAAVCLRGMNLARHRTEETRIRDRAVHLASQAAEVLSQSGGSLDEAADRLGGTVTGDTWTVSRNEADCPDAAFTLFAEVEPGKHPLLGTAKITVRQGEEILCSLTAAWQIPGEEACHE